MRTAQELLERARAEYHHGSLARAWEAVQAVATIGRNSGDARLVADAALAITTHTIGTWDLTAQHHALCQEALALVQASDPERAERLRALLAITHNPWQTPTHTGSSPSLDDARAAALSSGLHAQYEAAVGPDGVNTRLIVADELTGLAAASGRVEDAAWASLWRLEAHSQLGNRVAINAGMMTLAATVRTLASPVWQWRLAAARASLALLDAHLNDVPYLADAALQRGQTAGVEEAVFIDLVLRTSIAMQTGDGLEVVEQDVRRILAGAPFFAHGWRGRILLAMGGTDEALTIWRSLAPHLADLPRDAREWLVVTAGHADLCHAAHDTASAQYLTQQLAPYAEQHVTGGILTPYGGPVALYLGKLALTLDDRVQAREYFTRATTLSEQMHAPFFTAEARRCLTALADTRSPLTMRELDVAHLVATGLTNRQIAERLFLSERTIEHHVSSILRKLDTPTRTGVATHLT